MKSSLMIIDVQIGLVRLMSPELRESALSKITVLLRQARSSATPVLFVQHDGAKGHPLEAESADWAIHPAVLPRADEPVIRKKASDSFYETRLAKELKAREITHLTIAGAMTEYCVDTTCRRAITAGFDVTLVADAHLTRDTPALTAAQIIAHHNFVLDGFDAGTHSIRVKPAAEIRF